VIRLIVQRVSLKKKEKWERVYWCSVVDNGIDESLTDQCIYLFQINLADHCVGFIISLIMG
jgi:hypothetical protein